MIRLLATALTLTSVFVFSGCELVIAGKRLAERGTRADKDPVYTQPDFGANGDPRSVVKAAFDRVCDARSYRAKVVVTLHGGKSAVTNFEFVAPDRTRTATTREDGSQSETIIIGQRTFTRKKGQWSEVPLRYSSDREDFHLQCTLEGGPPQLPGVVDGETKLVGREVLSGVPVVTYRTQTDFDAAGGGTDSFVYTASVGVSDGRLYRSEMSTSKDPSLNVSTTTTYSDYDANITIEQPL